MANNSIENPEKIFHIIDKNSLGVVIRSISKLIPSKEKSYRIRITLASEDRTMKQNKLAFFWHKFRANINGTTVGYDRRFCKLQYGIPLLLSDESHEEFHTFYNNALLILPYEEMLQSMDFVPVTRIMNTKLFSEYLNDIDRDSAAEGIQLPQPIDLYYMALMKGQE